MDDPRIKDTCRLYVKLYCKRRSPYRYKLMEALQSWKSLNQHERELFEKKFAECRIKKRDKFVNLLTKTQPFLKKKTDKRSDKKLIKQENTRVKEEENTKSKETNNEVITNVEINNANQTTEIENSSSRMDDDSRLPNEIDIHEQTDCEIINPDHSNSAENIRRFIKEQQASLNNNIGQKYNGILTEPAPPTVLSDKKLIKQENTRVKEEENTKSKETNNEVITNVEINNANQTTEIENSSSRMDDDSRLPNEIDIHEQTDSEIINPDRSNSAENIKNIRRFFKEQQASLNNNIGQKYNGILTAPAPPIVLRGKELFESIQSANGNSTASWKSLTRKERSQYGKAVYRLKQTYIRNYKAFLEGLPSKELFKYYNDYFN